MKHIIENAKARLELKFKNDYLLITIIRGSKSISKVIMPEEMKQLADLLKWKVNDGR